MNIVVFIDERKCEKLIHFKLKFIGLGVPTSELDFCTWSM
jgi:hypothetical protein